MNLHKGLVDKTCIPGNTDHISVWKSFRLSNGSIRIPLHLAIVFFRYEAILTLYQNVRLNG